MIANKTEEQTDRTLNDRDILTSLEMLASAVETLNAVQLIILYNMKDITMPEWKTIKDIDEDVSDKVTKCVETVRRALDGQLKTDKS